MDKWIAGFLQAGAAVLLFVGGGQFAAVDDVYAIVLGLPAVASGIAGLLLWGRSERASLSAKEETITLQGQVARVEELAASLNEDVIQLREDREFFRKLYAEHTDRPQIEA